jgi:hypothetical protein
MTKAEIRIAIAAYVSCSVALAYLLLVSFGYIQDDGYGIYIPDVGGYHISSIDK